MRALDYHESTKHSWERIRANPHSLDFANMPLPFKIYSGVARQPLSTEPAGLGGSGAGRAGGTGSARRRRPGPGQE